MKNGWWAVAAVLLAWGACGASGDVTFAPASSAAGPASVEPVRLAAPAAGRPWVGVWFASGGDAVAAPLRLARWKDAADFVLTPFASDELAFCSRAGVTWAGEFSASSADSLPDSAALKEGAGSMPVCGWSVAPPSARTAPGVSTAECNSVKFSIEKLNTLVSGQDVVTALPDPWLDDEPVDLEPCWRAGSAAGVALWCGRTWDDHPESQDMRGLRIVREGDALRMSLPSQPATVFAEWTVTLPPAARLKFSYRAGSQGGDGVSLSVRVLAGLKPETVWQQSVPPRAPESGAWQEADIDLSSFAGSRIKLRLEAGPGEARQTAGDAADWQDPLLVASGGEASLIEHTNWWRMRAGYRASGSPRDVVTGVTGATFDPVGCELKLGLIAARCAAVGKPFLLNGVHPTGSTDTASPASLAAFWARVLPYKPASVVFHRAGAQEPGTAMLDVEPLVSGVARWRGFLQMLQPYAGVPRPRPAGFFVSPESGGRLNGARALEQFGLDIMSLNALGESKSKSVIIWVEYLNSQSAEALGRFLTSAGKGQKAIVFCDAPRGPGAGAVSASLPFRFEQGTPGEAQAAVPGGAALPVRTAARPVWAGTSGWEPVKGAGGDSLAAVRGSVLFVAGLPLSRPDGPDNALAKLAASWLGIQPYTVIDSGLVKIARGQARVNSEGLWCMETSGSMTVPSSYIAYDMIERQAASGTVSGPASLYCFAKRGARLVDPGVCFVRSQKMVGSDVVVDVECPASLSDDGIYQVIFWTPKTPAPSLESGGAWTVSLLGGGFWKAVCSKPGQYTLKITGAMLPKPPPTWNPVDH